MKRAVQTSLCLLLLIAASSNASAILRPRFPGRVQPPDSGQWITIEDHRVQNGSSNQSR